MTIKTNKNNHSPSADIYSSEASPDKQSLLTSLNKLWCLFSRRDKIKFGILVVFMVITGLSELAGIGIIPAFLGAVVTKGPTRKTPQEVTNKTSELLSNISCMPLTLSLDLEFAKR